MKKALKKIAVMVTIVALTMGNSVLSAAESGFSTQFEVSDPNEVYRWIYNHLSHISLNDADKQKIIEEYLDSSEFLYQFQHDKEDLKAYQGRHYNVAASEIKSCVEGSYIIHA